MKTNSIQEALEAKAVQIVTDKLNKFLETLRDNYHLLSGLDSVLHITFLFPSKQGEEKISIRDIVYGDSKLSKKIKEAAVNNMLDPIIKELTAKLLESTFPNDEDIF